jgi:hypothetical protein
MVGPNLFFEPWGRKQDFLLSMVREPGKTGAGRGKGEGGMRGRGRER